MIILTNIGIDAKLINSKINIIKLKNMIRLNFDSLFLSNNGYILEKVFIVLD